MLIKRHETCISRQFCRHIQESDWQGLQAANRAVEGPIDLRKHMPDRFCMTRCIRPEVCRAVRCWTVTGMLRYLLALQIIIGSLGDRHVSTGRDHACMVQAADGAIACAGEQDATGKRSSSPGPFHGVATGGNFTCGLATNHTVVCWGAAIQLTSSCSGGGSAACGSGRALGSSWLVAGDVTFLDIDAGEAHAVALRFNGSIDCGVVVGAPAAATAACTLPGPLVGARFVSVSAGWHVSCGVLREQAGALAPGAIACWGDSTNPIVSTSPPVGVFSDVSVGDVHACAIRMGVPSAGAAA